MMVIFLLVAANSSFMYLMALPPGFFTGYGSIVTGNFPHRTRSTAAGVIYNLARAVSFKPVLITTMAAHANRTTALAANRP
jgi:hypothetical protein